MAQAPTYTPQTNFAQDEINNAGGRSTVRTANLDAEFDAIEVTADALCANLLLLQRDDGKLRDGLVEPYNFSTTSKAYINGADWVPRGLWVTATAYAVGDLIDQAGSSYLCAIAHTSGTFNTDYAAGKWQILVSTPTAASMSFAPTGTLSSTNVQSAIQEVDAKAIAVRSDLVAATGAGIVGYLPPGTGSVATTVASKLGQVASVFDKMTAAEMTAVRARTGADITAKFQAAIDACTSGDVVDVPAGLYDVTGLRLDGSSGGLTNITLRGVGPASEIRIHAGSTNNVIRTAGGSGFRITGLRIRGGLGRGVTAVAAPSRGLWITGASYTAGQTVEVSSTDAATTTVAASNLVYVCTGNHTAGATFAGDKATYWAASAVANLNTVDISYGTRNNIYLDGVTNATVDNCELLDSVYAGVNVGTGPVQSANAGPGSSYVRVVENYFDNCTNGIAGGKMTGCVFADNTLKSCLVYGIVIDDPASTACAVTGNVVAGAGSHGIYLYGADTTTVSGNTTSFCAGVGILFENAAVGSPVVGNVCTNNLQGIRAYNSTISSVVGNACRANTQYGIAIELVSQISLSANACESNGFDGIRLTTVSGFSLNGNECSTNDGEGGLYLTGCSNGSINGGSYLNNNDAAVPSSTGAGVRLINSTSITISGVSAYDSRSGGAKTQKYGINATGTCDSLKLGVNSLGGNATSDFAITGSASRVAVDVANTIAAATPGNFTADRIVTYPQPDGTTIYLPARLGSW